MDTEYLCVINFSYSLIKEPPYNWVQKMICILITLQTKAGGPVKDT
jgi:hypothetical protein